jgi:prepilin-type N-terminal cleavage/methylation domain-containing protein
MPKTWAYCRRSEVPRDGGFTLLEILVVMVLLALVAGIVTPFGLRTVRNAESRSLERRLLAVLDQLPQRAFRQAEPLSFDGDSLQRELQMDATQGRLTTSQILRYRADGSAEGGELEWRRDDGSLMRWRIRRMTGEPQRLP